MATFFHCMVILGSFIGGYIFFNGLLSRGNMATDTVVALAFVIFPYCVARSMEYLHKPVVSENEEMLAVLRRINQIMEGMVSKESAPPPAPPPVVNVPTKPPRRFSLTGN